MKSLYGLKYKILDLDNLNIAYKIQSENFKNDPDYEDLYDKAVNMKDDNCMFLVYDNETLIGMTGVDVYREYPDTVWLDWFTVLSEHRRKGYGEKILLDTIEYCKKLNRYDAFRIEITYYKNRPALFLYDKIMELKENYTIEDTENLKNNTIIYSYSLNGKLNLWANKYLGLREYYDKLK